MIAVVDRVATEPLLEGRLLHVRASWLVHSLRRVGPSSRVFARYCRLCYLLVCYYCVVLRNWSFIQSWHRGCPWCGNLLITLIYYIKSCHYIIVFLIYYLLIYIIYFIVHSFIFIGTHLSFYEEFHHLLLFLTLIHLFCLFLWSTSFRTHFQLL